MQDSSTNRKSEYRFALAGNPNSGKTTLFNELTDSHYQVGNWAGVTIERKEGICRYEGYGDIRIIDLPGIYSLSPNSAEEIITKDYIISESPDLILNIVDATNIERNLYLTTQLAEMGIPVVIALNMMDALENSGINVDAAVLEEELGIKVVPISASKGAGIRNLVAAAGVAAEKKQCRYNMCGKNADAESRYKFISKATEKAVHKIGRNKQNEITEKIDFLMLHPVFSILLFLFIMFMIFQITFGPVGTLLTDGADILVNVRFSAAVSAWLNSIGVSHFLVSLITDGILAGVGGVISFFPQIMLLFLFLSFLEDSGYMARTAFIMDKLFAGLGLSGKSFISMLMGFGCTVPAVMSARTLENERDRRLTILLAPFMSCGAKMPVYAVFAGVFFPDNQGVIIFSLYLLGVILAVVSGLIFSRTIFKGEIPPFVLELPPYRIPTLKSTLNHMWDKAKDFAVRAGTVLLLASVVIWFLQNFDFRLLMVSDSENSMLGTIGNAVAPILTPCGFGDWRAAVSLLSGFAAKEAIVSTMGILYSAADTDVLSAVLSSEFNSISAYSFLVFVLLYTPCMAAVSAIHTEMNSWKWTVFSVCWQIGIAWVMSMAVYQTGVLLFG